MSHEQNGNGDAVTTNTLRVLAQRIANGEIYGRERAFHDEALRESAIVALRQERLAISEANVKVIIDEVRRLNGLTEPAVPAVDPLKTAARPSTPPVSQRFAATFPGAVSFAEQTRAAG